MKKETFYSLTYKTTDNGYQKLNFMKSLDRVKRDIRVKQEVYGLKCEIEEMYGTMFL